MKHIFSVYAWAKRSSYIESKDDLLYLIKKFPAISYSEIMEIRRSKTERTMRKWLRNLIDDNKIIKVWDPGYGERVRSFYIPHTEVGRFDLNK